MGVVRIQDLTVAPVALTGTEVLEIEQGGASHRTTAQAIADLGAGLSNPMTTAEDLIKGGTAGAPARLAVGTNGQVLTVTAGAVGWATPSSSGAVPIQDEGTPVVASPTAINFVGAGVTVTDVGGVATATIPGGGGGGGGVSLDDIGFGNIFVAMNVGFSPTTPFGDLATENGGGQAILPGDTTGSLMQKSRRNEGTGTTSASSFAGWRGASHAIINTRLPWKFTHQFGIANNPMESAHRAFVGVGASSSYSDNDISNLQRIIGVGYDSADTQWQFFTRDLGAVTKTALGASFPKPTVARAALYRLEMEFDGTTVSWTFTNLDTAAVATGSTSADLPSPAVDLHYIGRVSAGGVSTTPIFCMCPVFMRTYPL